MLFHTKFTVPLTVTLKDTGEPLKRWALYSYQILGGGLFFKCIQLFPLDFFEGVKDQINVEPFRNSCELTAGNSVVCSDYMLQVFGGFFLMW